MEPECREGCGLTSLTRRLVWGVGCGVWGEGGVEELSFAETSSLSALVHAENARAPTTAELGAIV